MDGLVWKKRTDGAGECTRHDVLPVEQANAQPQVKAGVEGRQIENARGIETRLEQSNQEPQSDELTWMSLMTVIHNYRPKDRTSAMNEGMG